MASFQRPARIGTGVILGVAMVLAVCNSRHTLTLTSDESELLPFKPVAKVSVPAKPGAKPVVLKQEQTYAQMFQEAMGKDSSLSKAYDRFRTEIPSARESGRLPELFNAFVGCPAFGSGDSLTVKQKSVLKRWVEDALAEKDETTRMLYSQYFGYFRMEDSYDRQFYIERTQMRPGDEVKLYRYSYYDERRRIARGSFTVEIARLTLDSLLRPVGFTVASMETTTTADYEHMYHKRISAAGVYRVTISGALYFQQAFVQVSWLDCAVKADAYKLLVFGSSYKDTVPPPYVVHCLSADGEIYTTKTDKQGLCVLRHNFGESGQAATVKVILEKGGQLAFMENAFPQARPDTTLQQYLYTDRPVYRPGHTVYFRGILKVLVDGRELGRAEADSIDIAIVNPEGTQVYRDTLAVDTWGHFGDSLLLGDNARQGRYSFQCNGIRNIGSHRRVHSLQTYRYYSFLVDAYKKPEFVITVKPEKETFLADEEVRIKVKGEYYFGGALAGVPVTVRWYRQGLYHYYRDWDDEGCCAFYPNGSRELLRQDNLKFDKDGALTITYKGPVEEAYGYVIAEVIATDQSRREVREEAQVKVVKHDAYVAVIPDKWEYEVGEQAKLEIVAVDLAGAALQGTVLVRVKKDKEILSDNSMPIPKSGRVHTTFPIKEQGTYQVEASAKDSQGKVVYVEQEIRAVKKRTWDWNWERVEVSLDKERYTIGDTARITVKAGADSTRTLCTIEGNRLWGYEVKRLADHALEYRLPLTREMGCNVGFYVVFSGATQCASAYRQLSIVDSTILLKVTLDGKRVLEPGAEYSAVLVVRDRTGQPVKANFSVALVDEAIFDVAKTVEKTASNGYYYWYGENQVQGILGMLPPYYQDRVSTQFNEFNPKFLVALGSVAAQTQALNAVARDGERMEEAKMAAPASAPARSMMAKKEKASAADEMSIAGAGGAAKDDKAMAQQPPPRERKDFKDLGYWNPSFSTGEDGQGSLHFSMPDDLTKWRLVLVGSDGAAHLLDFRDSVVTKQNIMVKLEAPRGFVTDDSAVVASVIHNYSDKNVDAKVSLDVKAGTGRVALAGDGTRTVAIEKNGTARVDWPLHIVKPGTVTFSTAVYTSAGNDAETRSYPVLYHGIKRAVCESGVLGETGPTAKVTLPSPQDAAPGSRELTIDYAPSLAYSMFESLDYLTGYPYGCVEQTMSRFLPNLYVASVMKKLGMHDDSLAKMIPKYTHDGLERLKKFQHGDEGWGWWENDKTDARMTALVVHGLSYAVKADIDAADKALAQSMLKRGAQSVLRQMDAKNDPQNAIDLAFSLIETDYVKQAEPQVIRVYEQRGKLSSYGLALLLECLHTLGKASDAAKVVELLETQVQEGGGMAWWPGSTSYFWYNQDQETTARVLRALYTVRPSDKLVPEAVAWLTHQKRDGYWVSTKTTAVVIEALARYVEGSGEFDPDYTATIVLNGKPVVNVKVTKGSLKNWQGRLVLPDSLIGAKNDLAVRMDGSGRLYYSVVLRYATTEKPIKAHTSGIEVTRTYTKLLYVQDKSGDWQVKREKFDGKLRSGDEVEVTISVKTARAYEHMLLEDYFPSGMTVLKKDQDWYSRWCGWWWWGYTHSESWDDRMVFFLDYVGGGERVFTYLLRAETPGKFIGLPARAELMYDPAVTGNSEELSVDIGDAR